MSKPITQFSCTNCGAVTQSWSGKCKTCGEWNTIIEEQLDVINKKNNNATAVTLQKVSELSQVTHERIKTNIKEFDRVLGGDDPGIVTGSIILLAGNPGVGKSTILLQVCSSINDSLYFSSEESLEQISGRLKRLNINNSSMRLSSERDLNRVVATIIQEKPKLVVIDSIQTVYDQDIAGTPGSVTQVRENCWRLQQLAKSQGVAILLVGHVTKEGVVAGPRVLEHLVDVVLYLEGDKNTGLRMLRGEKNRFGPTDEVGIWRLQSNGFVEVEDPASLFLKLVDENSPGRSLSVINEGSRAFIIEIQALVTKTIYGFPKRTAQGIDVNRLTLLLAVLENQLKVPLSSFDVYVNVVGGFSVKDPGTDLAIACAILSSYYQISLSKKLILIGEIGLLGEVRPAQNHATRVKEITRLKYVSNKGIYNVKALTDLFKKA
ncbi:DNA repair protein RadA [Candidatus Berkelbacteria bacterium]|nr:DNA repair protein RadA [Candidatus Berkelbacteria bacterium]